MSCLLHHPVLSRRPFPIMSVPVPVCPVCTTRLTSLSHPSHRPPHWGSTYLSKWPLGYRGCGEPSLLSVTCSAALVSWAIFASFSRGNTDHVPHPIFCRRPTLEPLVVPESAPFTPWIAYSLPSFPPICSHPLTCANWNSKFLR